MYSATSRASFVGTILKSWQLVRFVRSATAERFTVRDPIAVQCVYPSLCSPSVFQSTVQSLKHCSPPLDAQDSRDR